MNFNCPLPLKSRRCITSTALETSREELSGIIILIMFNSGFPACLLVICLANVISCGTTYPYTVYRGTFIHLPRLTSISDTPELTRNQGALWVSSDGRIKGHDWEVHDDATFQKFLSSHGWVDAATHDRGVVVKVVESNDDQNEFFFPGFIGMSCYNP